ncbi:hypothetical protein [Actinopolymorpha alba]|uniref:hypothetical protein n=1 Tax=Actinopolymorpha alba TaxID=533267 RepID=UPI000381F027|nr:hypothetical protein [Actinopolymorpha alba]
MRDVQKGRKSWLERLTSPPESEGDDGFQNEPHPFERTLETGAPPSREPNFPEGFEAFAPPGLRPPPSDDLRSAPPERSHELRNSLPSDRPHRPDHAPGPIFDAKSEDTIRVPAPLPSAPPNAVPSNAAPAPRDIWEGPVTPTRTEETNQSSESSRLSSTPPPPAPSLSWQPEPSSDLRSSFTIEDSAPELSVTVDEDDELSGPSEAEQIEAARKRHIDELQHRWLVTQAQLLDDPRDAVREAGLLIGDAMQFVTSTFTDHRDRIEREWKNNDSMSTDELRMVMRRYRNLFQYVLAASQLPEL